MIAHHAITRIVALAVGVVLLSRSDLRAQERMPPIPAEKMTEAQKKATAEFAAVRNAAPTGPFAVLLRVPELMDLSFKWRQHGTGEERARSAAHGACDPRHRAPLDPAV